MSRKKNVAVVVGAGPGLGAAFGRRFSAAGMTTVLVSRNVERLEELTKNIKGSIPYPCDASNEEAVNKLFDELERDHGPVEICIYNPGGGFQRVKVVAQTAERFRTVWEFTAFGGFLVGRAAARKMLTRGRGSIFYTGATASLRGGQGFSAFASGKFALRALAQSMARELGAEGIHVAHVNIDGSIGKSRDGSKLDPDDIAETYYGLYKQTRTNWTQELDIRPWTEKW